jgi:hypothetical protein
MDGEIGRVDDFIVEDETWTIRYVVVDTNKWLPGKRVLTAPAWVTRVDWGSHQVSVGVTKQAIEEGPKYDPSTPINRGYEARLYDFHGRPVYWG